MLITILLILAVVFALLALFGVPARVNWTAAGVLCLGIAMLLGRGLLS